MVGQQLGHDLVERTLGLQPWDPGPFHYSNDGAHLVSAILAKASGMTVLQYARSRLFDPQVESTPPMSPSPIAIPTSVDTTLLVTEKT